MHHGRCHCGRVQFEVEVPESFELHACNCSICNMVGYVHLIVPKAAVRFISGEADLTTYTFHTGIAKHTFCRVCGVKPIYVPRSNPDGYSVNARCLTPSVIEDHPIIPIDGQNWEQNVGDRLKHLS